MLKKNLPLIIAALLTLILRLPSFFEPYWYGDEGIYLILGQMIRRGAVLYRDIWDNKPPLLYLIYAIHPTLLWAKTAVCLSVILALTAIFKLAKLFFNNNTLPVCLTLLLSVLFLNLPILEGNLSNGELFMIAPALWGVYLALTAAGPLNFFGAGFLFSLAFLIKIPIAFDFLALFLFFSVIHLAKNFRKTGLRQHIKFFQIKLLPIATGFLGPILISVFYFWLNKALADYRLAAFSQNLTYTSFGNTLFSSNDLLFIKAAILTFYIISIIFIYFNGKKIHRWVAAVGGPPSSARSDPAAPESEDVGRGKTAAGLPASQQKPVALNTNLFLWLWFGFAAYGVLLGGRSYAHYLHQLVPPTSFLLASFFFNLNKQSFLKKTISLLSLITLITLILKFQFNQSWQLKPGYSFDYYQNLIQYLLDQKTQGAYFAFFDSRVNRAYQTAQYLQNHTQPNDKLFIWGDEAVLYALANRPAATRYIAAHHLPAIPGSYQEVLDKLQNNPVQYLVVAQPIQFQFAELESFLNKRYNLTAIFQDLYVYRISEKNRPR